MTRGSSTKGEGDLGDKGDKGDKDGGARQDKKARKDKAAAIRSGSDRARTLLARAVWLVAALFALVLAVGALLVAVDATNGRNELVRFVLDTAAAVDLGVFDRKDGVMKFKGEAANALVNWGLAAVVWLILGRVLDRVIRP